MSIHKSVLLQESIEGLNLKNGSIVVDATLGGGGHSREILQKILPAGKLIAIDQDESAIENFTHNLQQEKFKLKKENLIIIKENFGKLAEILQAAKIRSVDAVLADIGISSDQLDEAQRGFSFQQDGPLDMRMDQASDLTARRIANNYSQEKLEEIIKKYGEEKHANLIARKIIERRKAKPFATTLELAEVIRKTVGGYYRREKIHPATRTFQALRIEVNQELANLEKFLESAIDILKKEGRLGIISFHSLEDRIVKNVFRQNARGCICPKEFPICQCGKKARIKIITKKPIAPGAEEIQNNPRARSAKLRICEKI